MVMKSTLANDSKEMQAFSDFPPPKGYPPYISHWLQDEYFNLYADKFDLRKYISLKTEVNCLSKAKKSLCLGQRSEKSLVGSGSIFICTFFGSEIGLKYVFLHFIKNKNDLPPF